MKGLQKLTSIRLAEVLTQKAVVPADTITDALYMQDKHGDPFVENLVASGHINEWDLARVVVEHFQLPFILAGNYDIADEARDKIDKELLFESLVVPLDVFDEVVTVSMPILTPYQSLQKIQKQHNVVVYPYVGLVSENKKVLGELFSDFNDWLATSTEERKKKADARLRSPAKQDGGGEGDWMNVFDSGEQAVRSAMTDTPGKSDSPEKKEG